MTATTTTYRARKVNTTFAASRMGSAVEDTYRFTIYYDGVPHTFTTTEAGMVKRVSEFVGEGFEMRSKNKGQFVEGWFGMRAFGDPEQEWASPDTCRAPW